VARVSRKVGPDATFNFLGTDQDIPQCAVTREFGDGFLLILLTLRVNNIVAAATIFEIQLHLDGVALEGSTFSQSLVAGGRGTITIHAMQRVRPGLHTILARGRCTVSNDGQMNVNRGVLTVIELPLVEVVGDLTL